MTLQKVDGSQFPACGVYHELPEGNPDVTVTP
jgi:hypothetical protein